MLDSYRDRVEELLDAGCTFADISDHMAEEEQIYVEPTTVAYFVRSRKLSSKVTQVRRVRVPTSGHGPVQKAEHLYLHQDMGQNQ